MPETAYPQPKGRGFAVSVHKIAGLAVLVTAECGGISITPEFNRILQTKRYDNYGQKIQILFDSQETNKANAALVDGIPTIYLNPNWMAQLSPEERTFVFFHEVAPLPIKPHLFYQYCAEYT